MIHINFVVTQRKGGLVSNDNMPQKEQNINCDIDTSFDETEE